MIKLSVQIDTSLADALEEYFCEFNVVNWSLERNNAASPTFLCGFFDSAEDGMKSYADMREKITVLPEELKSEPVNDYDWKNEYKKYLTAWRHKNLHWVPLWMKPSYTAPKGDKVFYFDAGLAFGTGDHPTTRLCAIAMCDWLERTNDAYKKLLVDAGCGSGILALSAKLLGMEKIFGFDRDEEAVRMSAENAEINGIDVSETEFEHAGIEKALASRKADIMLANIQADVLCIYADNLVNAMNPDGLLVLSGILAEENAKVKKYFETRAADRIKSCEADFMDGWSSLKIEFRGREK